MSTRVSRKLRSVSNPPPSNTRRWFRQFLGVYHCLDKGRGAPLFGQGVGGGGSACNTYKSLILPLQHPSPHYNPLRPFSSSYNPFRTPDNAPTTLTLQGQLAPLGNFMLKGIRDLVPVFEFAPVPGREFPPIDPAPESSPGPDLQEYSGAQVCGRCMRPLRCRACKPLLSPRTSVDSARSRLSYRSQAGSFRTENPASPVHHPAPWARRDAVVRDLPGPPDRERTGSTISLRSDPGRNLLPGQPPMEESYESDPDKCEDSVMAPAESGFSGVAGPSMVVTAPSPVLASPRRRDSCGLSYHPSDIPEQHGHSSGRRSRLSSLRSPLAF